MKWFFGVVLLGALGLAGWVALMLNWSYAEGERAGYVQKLSKKGWICKTWEGEIALVSMPGTVNSNFSATVPGIDTSAISPSHVLQIQPYLESFCT